MIYALLARKGFSSQLQYRAAHMVNNVASAIFGFVYMAIWQAATSTGTGVGAYTPTVLVAYVAYNQAFMMVTTFLTYGLGLPERVRTGSISLDMMRPVGLFGQTMGREAGLVVYNLIFRSLPLFIVFYFVPGIRLPDHVPTLVLGFVSLGLGCYVGLCLAYLVGLSSFWTTEARWAHWAYLTLHAGFSGFLVPLDLLPKPLALITPYLPFSAQNYYPARMWLGLAAVHELIVPLSWALLLTTICLAGTMRARRRIEVQGG